LGHTITSNGKCETEIRKGIGMAKSTFNNMKQVLTNKQIFTLLKKRLVKRCIHSTFMYVSKTWTLKKTTEKKIKAIKMWIYRRIGRFSWTENKTNIEVLKQLRSVERTTECNSSKTNEELWAHKRT
jgi:hypothetical protein